MALRVMTWNLWWRFGPFEQRRKAIVDVIRAVDPDVLCLQEVWSSDDEEFVAVLGAALEMHGVRTDRGNGQSFGNAVLARWPLERIESSALPDHTGSPGHRQIVAARIASPFGPWPVASTHFDHRFDASATRRRQAERLLELAVAWRGDAEHDLPVIVGADLNAVADADEVQLLTGRRAGVEGIVFSDAWEQAGDGDGSTWRRENPYTADTAWPDRRLDYLLVSWPRPKPTGNPIRAWLAGSSPVDVDGTAVWPSDHAAVVAEFTTPSP